MSKNEEPTQRRKVLKFLVRSSLVASAATVFARGLASCGANQSGRDEQRADEPSIPTNVGGRPGENDSLVVATEREEAPGTSDEEELPGEDTPPVPPPEIRPGPTPNLTAEDISAQWPAREDDAEE